MIPIALELFPPDDADREAIVSAVDRGLNVLTLELALPVAVELSFGQRKNDVIANLNGQDLAAHGVITSSTADEYSRATISAVTNSREMLVTPEVSAAVLERAGIDSSSAQARWAIHRIVRLGVRADRVLPYLEEVTTWDDADNAIAAATASTDDTPFHMQLPRGTPGLSTQEELEAFSDLLRIALFTRRGIAIRSTATTSETLPPWTGVATVREVSYPPLRVVPETSDGAGAEAAFAGLFAHILGMNADAIVTPRYVDMVLAQSHLALPVATRLARERWPGNSLIEALRNTITSSTRRPGDVTFVIERLSLVGSHIPGADGASLIPFAASECLPVADTSPPTFAVQFHRLFA